MTDAIDQLGKEVGKEIANKKGLVLDTDNLRNEPISDRSIVLERREALRQAAQVLSKHTLDPNDKVTLSQEYKKIRRLLIDKLPPTVPGKIDTFEAQLNSIPETMSPISARTIIKAMLTAALAT